MRVLNVGASNELVYFCCFWLGWIENGAVFAAECVIARGITIERDIFGKFNELGEVTAGVSVASSLQSHILIIDAHFNIVIRSSHILPKFKNDLRGKWRVSIEGMFEGC